MTRYMAEMPMNMSHEIKLLTGYHRTDEKPFIFRRLGTFHSSAGGFVLSDIELA